MTSSEIWGEDVAHEYDDHSAEMFTDAVLGPTVDFLAGLAGRGERPRTAPRGRWSSRSGPVWLGSMADTTVDLGIPGAGPGGFAVVYLVFNTIMNVLTQDEQVECFRNAARHLRPGGHFVIECMVPDLRSLPPGQLAFPFEVTEQHLGFDTYDLVDQILVSHHFRPLPDGSYQRFAGAGRYVWPAELDLMARLAGLRLVERVTDWHRRPFTGESRSHVSVWQAPDAG